MSQDVNNNTQSQGIAFLTSFTAFAAKHTTGHLHTNKEDGPFKTVVKLTLNTFATTILAVAGLVETVVRTALVLVAKAVQFLIPKQWTEKFDEYILKPLYESAGTNAIGSSILTANIVNNFRSQEARFNTIETIENKIHGGMDSKFMQGLMNLHFNGFYAPKTEGEDEAPPIDGEHAV